MDSDLYLLDFNKNKSKLSFSKKIESLEFVEIIGNMGLDLRINYKKRDAYLKKYGKKLFRKFPPCKTRDRKLQITINHQTEYLSNKKYGSNRFLNGLNKIIENFFKWKIIVAIDIIKYKYGSTENIKQNNYNNCSENTTNRHRTEVLSQEEIDLLLTAINADDEETQQ
jgi:hypothetical protein